MLAVEYDFNGMVMAMTDSIKNYGCSSDGSAESSTQSDSNAPTESQKRVMELMDRHEQVLAFNRKLEQAIANKDYALIDQCLAESKNNEHMEEHRRYMAELQRKMAASMTVA